MSMNWNITSKADFTTGTLNPVDYRKIIYSRLCQACELNTFVWSTVRAATDFEQDALMSQSNLKQSDPFKAVVSAYSSQFNTLKQG